MFQRILPFLALLLLGFHYKAPAQKTQGITGFEKYQQIGGELPNLKVVSPTFKEFSEKDLKKGQKLFLILFNPTCSHCINTAKLISQNAALFKNTKVVFMATPNMMSYLNEFISDTKLSEHTEVIIGVDKAYAVEKVSTYGVLPQINIYNGKHKLVKTFKGDVTMADLSPYLK